MTAHPEPDAERALERDLQAYRSVTDRDLPGTHTTAQLLEHSATTTRHASSREGFWMKSLITLQARPWLATAAGAAIVAAVLGIVPISYTRTTGHEATLELAAPAPAGDALATMAAEWRAALHAEGVRVDRSAGAGGATAEIVASIPSRNRTDVQRTAAAFATALAQRGIASQTRVRPRTERISSNVYALAMDRAVELRVERAGKTPAEVEADIRAQLEAAGIQNPQVQVTEEDGQTKVRIQAESTAGDGREKLDIRLHGAGDAPLEAELQRFHVERQPGMTDADVKADVERQMREAGVTGEVTVEHGKIEVKVYKEP